MKIGILGKMGSGKSTLAMILSKKYNLKILSFGQKVKDIAKDLFGMKDKDRSLLQKIGESMRNIDQLVWINYILNNIGENDNIVIDDVRYENEILALKKNGFTIIYLDISREMQIQRLSKLYANFSDHIKNNNHESERADNFRSLADIKLNADNNIDEYKLAFEYLDSINNLQVK